MEKSTSYLKCWIYLLVGFVFFVFRLGLGGDDTSAMHLLGYMVCSLLFGIASIKLQTDSHVAFITWTLVTIGLITQMAFELKVKDLLKLYVLLFCAIFVSWILLKGYEKLKDRLENKYFLIFLLVLNIIIFGITLGVGFSINGTRAWIGIPNVFSFQTTEINVLISTILIAEILDSYNDSRKGMLLLVGLWLVDTVFLVWEHELGSLLLISFLIVFSCCFFMDSKTIGRFFIILIVVALTVSFIVYRIYISNKTRDYSTLNGIVKIVFDQTQKVVERFKIAYCGEEPLGAGYQSTIACYEMYLAGLTGRFLIMEANLPVRESEYIYVSAVYYFGWIIGAVIILLYIGLWIRGIGLAALKDRRRALYTVCSSSIFLNAVINILGETRIIPLTGMVLPFMSKGGSALIRSFTLALIIRSPEAQIRQKNRRRIKKSEKKYQIQNVHS